MQSAYNTNQDLALEIGRMRDEIDALQVALMKRQDPWFKNVSVVVSVLALLFSFGTTYVSYNRTNAQDIQSLRSELRGVLQRLASLPKENFEMAKKYQDDPDGSGLLSSLTAQENSLLVRQAAEMARKLPVGQVSAIEYFSIASALRDSYDIDGAMEFQRLAFKSSTAFADSLAATRMLADLLFLQGQPEAGRMEYQRALNIFSRYKGYHDYVQKSTHIMTELNWASSEAQSGFFDLANQHIASAELLVSALPPGPGSDQLRKQIDQRKRLINRAHPLVSPFLWGP